MATGRLLSLTATGTLPQSKGRLLGLSASAGSPNTTGRLLSLTVAVSPSVTISAPQSVNWGGLASLVATCGWTVTSWEWEQTSGTSVSLTGTNGNRNFLAPALTVTETLSFRVRAQVGSTWTDWATSSVEVLFHPWWAKRTSTIEPLGIQFGGIAEPAEGLPFAVAPNIVDWTETSLSGRKRIFAHLFPQFPRSIGNASPEESSYYVSGYNSPTGESSSHAAYGSFLRDRPVYRAPLSGDYKFQDALWEIQQAQAAGLDGFVVDLLSNSLTHDQTVYALKVLDAADTLGGTFKVLPMLDTNGAMGDEAAPYTNTIAVLRKFALDNNGQPRLCSWWTSDNKWVMGSYVSQTNSSSWWSDLHSTLAANIGAAGISMIASMSSNWTTNMGAGLASVSVALGDWGSGDDPALVANRTNRTASAHALGKLSFAPLGFQQVRPKAGVFDESVGTGALRQYWVNYLTENPDMIQMVTWSDFSEGSTFIPTVARGSVGLDISTYYMIRWKTGSYPNILRDAAYLSHRTAPIGASSVYGESQQMVQWIGGGARPTSGQSAPQNIVEAVVLLTAPAVVRITTAAGSTDFSAPAGLSVWTVPLAVGAPPSVSVIRGGVPTTSVTSTRPVKAAPYLRDGTWFSFASLRGTIGQEKHPHTLSGY